ncbi:MAG TPA: sterol desaturase family protein, partial [bacterium]|nr:sterol desaturase family protein [bacterium]
MEQFHNSYYFRYVFPVLVVLILIEAVLYRRKFSKPYPWMESLSSLGVATGHQLTGYINQIVVIGLLGGSVWEHRLWTVPADNWWHWALLFFGVEFAYYWYHRAAHEVHWMWAAHSTHHSPNELTLSAAYRLNWTPLLSLSSFFYLPLIWLGFT